jgi:hypothetical protein
VCSPTLKKSTKFGRCNHTKNSFRNNPLILKHKFATNGVTGSSPCTTYIFYLFPMYLRCWYVTPVTRVHEIPVYKVQISYLHRIFIPGSYLVPPRIIRPSIKHPSWKFVVITIIYNNISNDKIPLIPRFL